MAESETIRLRISKKLRSAAERQAAREDLDLSGWIRRLIAKATGLEESAADLKQGLAALSKKRRKEIASQGGTAKGESASVDVDR